MSASGGYRRGPNHTRGRALCDAHYAKGKPQKTRNFARAPVALGAWSCGLIPVEIESPPGSGSLQWCRPIQLARPPTLLRPGQPPAVRVGSMGGEGKAVQGLSWGRWRCCPSFQESPFLGRIQGVEVVEVSADPAAAGLRVGPGGSCRRRVGARLARQLRPTVSAGQPPAAAALAATSTAGRKEDRTGRIVAAAAPRTPQHGRGPC